MGAELFEMSWVQGIVQFFNYLAWTLYVIGLIVACFECGINYAGGKGDIRAVALNAIKGFMAASLFSVVPVRLYQLAISLQAEFTSGMTGYGTSIGEVAANIIQEYEEIETVADLIVKPISGFEAVTSPIMVIVCIIMMAYAVIKVFFANLKRGGILLIQIAVGSLYMFSIPRGGIDAFVQWMKQVIGVCLTAFLQATILIAGLLVFKEHALLGIGLMLSSSEITRIAGAFSSGEPHGEDFRIVLEEIIKICVPDIYVPRPHAGKFQSAGWIRVGDTLSVGWRVADAQHWGVPQRRARIFLVADFGGLTAPKILFKPESLPGYTAPSEGSWKTAAEKIGSCFAGAGGLE